MVRLVGADQRVKAIVRFWEPLEILGVVPGVCVLAGAESVNVGPCCLAGDKRCFGGRDTNDFPIFAVQILKPWSDGAVAKA